MDIKQDKIIPSILDDIEQQLAMFRGLINEVEKTFYPVLENPPCNEVEKQETVTSEKVSDRLSIIRATISSLATDLTDIKNRSQV